MSLNQTNPDDGALSNIFILNKNKQFCELLNEKHKSFDELCSFLNKTLKDIDRFINKWDFEKLKKTNDNKEVTKIINCIFKNFCNKLSLVTDANKFESMLEFLDSLEETVKFALDDFQNNPKINKRSEKNLDNKLRIVFDIRDVCDNMSRLLKRISIFIESFTDSKLKKDEVVSAIENWNQNTDTYNRYFESVFDALQKAKNKTGCQQTADKFKKLSDCVEKIISELK